VLFERYSSHYEIGDVILFDVSVGQIPWIHRVIGSRETPGGLYEYLTKGDNNLKTDYGAYANQSRWLRGESVYGRVVAVLPQIGQFALLMDEIPFLRVLFIVLVALLYLVSKNGVQ